MKNFFFTGNLFIVQSRLGKNNGSLSILANFSLVLVRKFAILYYFKVPENTNFEAL